MNEAVLRRIAWSSMAAGVLCLLLAIWTHSPEWAFTGLLAWIVSLAIAWMTVSVKAP